jgi:putrescine aminotransferase
VRDSDGREYLDCGGYGVFLLGHRHPAVIAAVHDQLDRLPLSTRAMVSPPLARAAESLAARAPEGLDYVFFGSTGSEAAELALKLARLAGRRRVVAMRGGYHGMTLGALSLTSNPAYGDAFAPLVPGVEHVPFGEPEPLARALGGRGGSACVILEPIQGEAGVVVPPAGYLRAVESICREHGAFLVLDEIQTGLGRAGCWWVAEREGVRPDVLLAGKPLGGGVVPVSAVVATAEAYEPLNRDPLLHRSTFSNSPLQTAAVAAALDVIADEDLPGRAELLGSRLRPLIRSVLDERCPGALREVRGAGLLIGIELASDALAAGLMFELFQRGVISTLCTSRTSVLRLTPPAILDDVDVELLTGALEAAATAVAAAGVPDHGG